MIFCLCAVVAVAADPCSGARAENVNLHGDSGKSSPSGSRPPGASDQKEKAAGVPASMVRDLDFRPVLPKPG